MTDYILPDDLFARYIVQPGDPFDSDSMYVAYCSVRTKFDSVAAAIMWEWSLGSSQDETSGDAQYGNGWHALFRDERAILHTDNAGFVSAWRVEDGADIDAVWEAIEKGAVYEDDVMCEGHESTDGPIGNVVYCDATCREANR